MAGETPTPGTTSVRAGQDLLPLIRHTENSGDDETSPAGAVGRYQIMPGTARHYGFDPLKLTDPAYNEKAAATILNDLHKRFSGDVDAIMVGYNAGPTVASRWLRNNRQFGLPLETMKYLERGHKFLRINGLPKTPYDGSAAQAPAGGLAPDPEPQVAPGQQQYKKLLDGGFSADQANSWRDTTTSNLLKAGFKPSEVQSYWGENAPDPKTLDSLVQSNFARTHPDDVPRIAGNALEQIAAGWDMSVTGLATAMKPPQIVLPENAGMGAKILFGAGQLAGDLPAAAAGFIEGGAAGASAGEAVFPPGGGAVGGIAGAGAGAFGLPQAMREVMMDTFKRGEVHSFKDFAAMATGSLLRTGKATLTGLLSAPLGFVGGKIAAPVVGNTLSKVADVATQVTSATAISAGLDGHVPNSDDFITASVLALGFTIGAKITAGPSGAQETRPTPAAEKVSENLKDIYRQTGQPPWEVLKMANADPVIKQEILAEDPSGHAVIPKLRLNAPADPEPYHPNETEILPEPQKTPEEHLPTVFTSAAKTPEAEVSKGAFKALSSSEDGTAQEIAYGATAEEATAAAKEAVQGKLAKLNEGGAGGKGPPPPEDAAPGTPNERGRRKIEAKNGFGPHPPEVLNEIAAEMIGEQPTKDSDLNPSTLYRQWVSELGPVRAIDKMLATKGFNREQQVGLEDMFRQTYASDARAGYFVRRGGLDPITLERATKPGMGHNGGPEMVPSIMDAVRRVREDGGNMRDWLNYMVAQRSIAKTKQGFDTGHPLTIEEQHQLVEAGAKKYEAATKTMQETLDSVLDYGRLSSVFSKEQVAAMKRDNATYVSFRRISGDEATAPTVRARGRGFRVREPVRRFEGSDRRIIDPMLATIDNIHQIVRMADRNRAVGSVIALAERHGLLEDLGLKQLSDQSIKPTLAEPNSDIFKPYDIADSKPYEPFLAVRAGRKVIKDNQFIFIRDGKPEVWEAKDPFLAALMRGSDAPWQTDIVSRAFQGFASLQRAGITGATDFPVRNVLRDQITSFIADPHSPPPFATWLRGAVDVLKQGDRYWDWVAKGGAGSALVDMDIKALHTDMHAIFEKTGVWDHLWNTVRHPLEASQILMEKLDSASRVGFKQHMEDQNYDPLKAATMSRKAYIDFVEKGTLGLAQWWSRAVPFMHANFLGMKQFGEAMAEKPGNTLAKAAIAITAPTMVLYALNYLQDEFGGLPEDRKFKNIPRYWKDGMYIFPEVGGVRMRIPSPPMIGPVFGGLPTRFLDHFLADDPAAFHQWASTIVASIVPPFVPSLVLPPLEHWANRNFFTGKALMPEYLKGASGEMQYTEATSEPAKQLSSVLGKISIDMSPIYIENYVRGWVGSLGMVALRALNAPFDTSGKPWELSDVPFVQSFLIRNPGASAAPIQAFYDEKQDFDRAAADKRLALDRMKTGSDNEGELNRALDEAQGDVTNVAEAIQLNRSLILSTYHDKEMSDAEKRQAIDDLYGNMITFAQFGTEKMKLLKEAQQ